MSSTKKTDLSWVTRADLPFQNLCEIKNADGDPIGLEWRNNDLRTKAVMPYNNDGIKYGEGENLWIQAKDKADFDILMEADAAHEGKAFVVAAFSGTKYSPVHTGDVVHIVHGGTGKHRVNMDWYVSSLTATIPGIHEHLYIGFEPDEFVSQDVACTLANHDGRHPDVEFHY